MNKVLYFLFLPFIFAACAKSYSIDGSSNVSTLDGKMLYLKVLSDTGFKKIDSCEVVHGAFSFHGKVDSACMANLFMDDESLLPLVLEEGNISVALNNAKQNVTGTELNDKLFKFFNQYNQIKNQEIELVRKHDQAIMNGSDMNVVIAKLQARSEQLAHEEDQLVTSFVTDNFDNVLGPGVFFMLTIGQEYPELTPWLEDIMSKATDRFKANAYVKDYYQKAKDNQQIMNGMKDVSVSADTMCVPTAHVNNVPTPKDLAKPAKP